MNTPDFESSRGPAPALQLEVGATRRWRRPRSVWLVPLLALTAIGTAGVIWLRAQGPQPAFGSLAASPPNFVFNTAARVTFTIQIDTPTLNPTTVELQRVDAAGHVIAGAGRMYDNGQNGDSQPGDKIFSSQVTLTEPGIGNVYFRVAAAFRGNRQNAWSAPIAVDVDPFPLPPDPGEAGKQTLEGIDSDNDGVRDDVQRWIALSYSEDIPLRDALTQLTKVNQNFINQSDTTPEVVRAIAVHRHRALDCLSFVSGGARTAYERNVALRTVVLNTPQRSRAFLASDAKLSGTFFTVSDPALRRESCDQIKSREEL